MTGASRQYGKYYNDDEPNLLLVPHFLLCFSTK